MASDLTLPDHLELKAAREELQEIWNETTKAAMTWHLIDDPDHPPPRKAVLVYEPGRKNTWAAYQRDGRWFYWGDGLEREIRYPLYHWMHIPPPPGAE